MFSDVGCEQGPSWGAQLEDSYDALSGILSVSTFSSSSGFCVGQSMVSLFLPYYLYKVTSVFLPTGSVGEASPQAPTINEQEKRHERLEKLKRELQNIKNARDELQGILANYTNKDLNDR